MSRYNGNGLNGGSSMAYHPRSQRDHEPLSKTNVFIRGLGAETSDNDLLDLCSKYGPIVSSKSITDRVTNECKGYGFVNFENPNDAAVAVRELTDGGYQARMSKEGMGRSERFSSFDRRSPPDFRRNGGSGGAGGNPRYNGANGGGSNGGGGGSRQLSKTNLYLRGLDAQTSDNDLHALCTRYGTILSAKAIVDRTTNECKGYGFVNFDSAYAAEQAVTDLSSKGYQVQMSRETRMPRQILVGAGPAWQ